MKVYAVYSIPKSPEYYLMGLFKSKVSAKSYIKKCNNIDEAMVTLNSKRLVYDIQIEEVVE